MTISFKLYLTDTGLFISMLDENIISDIMFGNMGIYKGVIYENIVADALIKKINFLYIIFQKTQDLKLIFVERYEGNITLIEVKARNGNTKKCKNYF
ncbi:MAG: DUF4143 domain-containing protein [Clostridium sp.]|nr:MAG: DUF4143 domain-containing protein [Clostridium sp.]